MWRLCIKYQGNIPYNLKIMVFLSCNIRQETWQNPLGKVSEVLLQLPTVTATPGGPQEKNLPCYKFETYFPVFFPKWCIVRIVVIQTETSYRFLGSAKNKPKQTTRSPARSPARSPCLKWSSSSSTGNKCIPGCGEVLGSRHVPAFF